MYNRLYEHLSDNDTLHRKQFGFQEKLSSEYVVIELVDQINCSFKKNISTAGIFIDLSKLILILKF